MGSNVVSRDIDKAGIAAENSLAGIVVGRAGAGSALDEIDVGEIVVTFVDLTVEVVLVKHLGEVGRSPGEPNTTRVRLNVGRTCGRKVGDEEQTRLDGVKDGNRILGALGVVEDILERIVGMATAVEEGLVATTDLEVATTVGTIGGVVDPDGIPIIAVLAEDVTEGVYSHSQIAVEVCVLGSFPEGDGADGGAGLAKDELAAEVKSGGPGVGVEEKISLYCVSIQGNTGYCDKSLNDLLLKIFNHNNNSNVEIFQSFQLSTKFERKSKLLELLFIL